MDAGPEKPRSLPWPLFTIDFEATGLQPGNYPIEVGVCRWLSPDTHIEGWSTLIRPPAKWDCEGTWSVQAEAMHGIRREDLRGGSTPEEAVVALNAIIGSQAAFCDGGAYDFSWSRRLVLAAGVMNTFKLGNYDMLTAGCDAIGCQRLLRWLGRTPARHRARDDAERLMKALARGLGFEHGTSTDIDARQENLISLRTTKRR